jgi:ADP-ribosyl-[dinitrogen reductase] hydrolase
LFSETPAFRHVSVSADRVVGSLMATAVGDALGMPIEGLSHSNVRTYYKGIKEYRDDDQRGDLDAGQWTDDTQMTFALVRALTAASDPADWPAVAADEYVALRPDARRWGKTSTAAIDRLANGTSPTDAGTPDRDSDGAAMRAAPLGAWWAATEATRADAFAAIRPVLSVTHRHPAALAAGWGQAVAVRALLRLDDLEAFDRDAFWATLIEETVWAEDQLDGDHRVSERLRSLDGIIDSFPLDLRDACDGVGVRADEAWPFACAMVARRPHLLENTLLSGINVGGDADTTGAMMGAMLGALHGWAAFPDEWHEGLEDAERLENEAQAFAKVVRARKP